MSIYTYLCKLILGQDTIENRVRILFEVVDAVAAVIPKNRIGIRFNPSTHGLFGMNIDEQTIPTYKYMVEKLNAYGLAYLHFMDPF
jgi:N-ethylmaleimide reductase